MSKIHSSRSPSMACKKAFVLYVVAFITFLIVTVTYQLFFNFETYVDQPFGDADDVRTVPNWLQGNGNTPLPPSVHYDELFEPEQIRSHTLHSTTSDIIFPLRPFLWSLVSSTELAKNIERLQSPSSCPSDQRYLLYTCNYTDIPYNLDGAEENIPALVIIADVTRALSVALATNRTLVFTTQNCASNCTFIRAPEFFDTCCAFSKFFLPITTCKIDDQVIRSDLPLYNDPFSSTQYVTFRSEIHNGLFSKVREELYMRGYFLGDFAISRILVSYVMRPQNIITSTLNTAVTKLENVLHTLYSTPQSQSDTNAQAVLSHPSNPPPQFYLNFSTTIGIYIQTLSQSDDRFRRVRMARTHYLNEYIFRIREVAALFGPRVAVLWTSDDSFNILSNSIPHLHFINLPRLVSESLNLTPDLSAQFASTSELESIVSLLFLSHSDRLISSSESIAGRILDSISVPVDFDARFDISVSNLEDLALDSTNLLQSWEFANHFFRSSLRKAYTTSALPITHLLTPLPADVHPPRPLPIIIVVGAQDMGVRAMSKFLQNRLKVRSDKGLSLLWTSLFTIKLTKDDYLHQRQAFASALKVSYALDSDNPFPLLLEYYTDESEIPEKSLMTSMANILSQLVYTEGLPIDPRIIFMMRDPYSALLHRTRILTIPVDGRFRPDQQLLYEARIMADNMASLEGELGSLQFDSYITFDYNQVFGTKIPEEGSRLAAFMRFPSEFVISELANFTATLRNDLFPQLYMIPSMIEQSAMDDLFQGFGSLPAYNPCHPSRYLSVGRHDPLTLFAFARRNHDKDTYGLRTRVVEETLADRRMQLLKVFENFQFSRSCTESPLMVFDGFLHWNDDSATHAASQILQILRSFSVALSTGRILVLPKIAGSVLEHLLPFSQCTAADAGLRLVDGKWKLLSGGDHQFPHSAFSKGRVIVGHSDMIDLSFISVLNAYASKNSNSESGQPVPVIGAKMYIETLTNWIVRPNSETNRILHTLRNQFTTKTLVVVLPKHPLYSSASLGRSIVQEALNFGLNDVALATSDSIFADNPNNSSVECIEYAEDVLDALPTIISQTLEALSVPSNLLSVRPADTIFKEIDSKILTQLLRMLLISSQSSRLLSSFIIEESFVVSNLWPIGPSIGPQRSRSIQLIDLYGHSFLDAISMLDQQFIDQQTLEECNVVEAPKPVSASATSVRETYSSLALTVQQKLPMPYSKVSVRKSIFSNKLRFVFVAGLEGTGHHFFGHLLATMRTLRGADIDHRNLKADETTTSLIWNLFNQYATMNHYTYHSQIVHILRTICTVEHGSPSLFVLNVFAMGNAGMQSYPNIDAADKDNNHPRIAMLAKFFEEAQCDLRVISLVRSPGSSFVSTIKRQHSVGIVGVGFNYYYQARILHNNLAYLDADIRSLDPAFTLVLDLEHLNRESLRYATSIADHLGLEPSSFTQSLMRLSAEFAVQPSNNWKMDVLESDVPVEMDFFANAQSLSVHHGVVHSVGPAYFPDNELCYPLSKLKVRYAHPKSPYLLHTHGPGGDYLRLLLEQITGVLTVSSTGRLLDYPDHYHFPSSYNAHIKQFSEENAFGVILLNECLNCHGESIYSSQYKPIMDVVESYLTPGSYKPVDPQPNTNARDPPPRAVIMFRNPLDTVLASVYRAFLDDESMNGDRMLNFYGGAYRTWLGNNLGRLQSIVSLNLRTIAESWVKYTHSWLDVVTEYNPSPLGNIFNPIREYNLTKHNGNDNSAKSLYIFQYEALVESPGTVLPKLLKFFDLDPEPKSLACMESALKRTAHPAYLIKPIGDAGRPVTPDGRMALSSEDYHLDSFLLSLSWDETGTESRPFFWPQVVTSYEWEALLSIVQTTAIRAGYSQYLNEADALFRRAWGLGQRAAPLNPPDVSFQA